ncbi:MAG: hypothetical protein IK124_00350 [Prevotella sp.]|nr:hypothetical protein [Prevotella sp.]
MKYEKEILRILSVAGSTGLSVKKIARHVFNASNTFFEVLNYDEVYQQVQQYLLRNSKQKDSLFERMDARGVYRLNANSAESLQLMLQFLPEEEDQQIKTETDQSLSLFDEL